jgi:sugar/nucleoside kinase (ribokinase family)
MPQVACLGILVADLLGRPIDDLPPRGRLGLVENMSLHIGGCAANTGIDLARLGVDTALLGKVGTDGLGDFVVNTLERNGMDPRGVVRDDSVNTSASMVLVAGDGERTFLHYLGGNAQYREADVDWAVIRASKLLHVAGALVMPAFDGQPMARVLQQAKQEGLTTSLDVVWDATGKWMKMLGPCLPHTDYFMPSLAEAQEITRRRDVKEVARALTDAGVKTVALKLGEEGCYIRTPDAEVSAPGMPVEAVDGTGAGDAFDAGFLCGVVNGWDLERTAHFANAVGALCVTAVGATAGVRSFAETEEFLRSRGAL